MDTDAKKKILRMIPYGIYVLTAKSADGGVAAATVNWLTQVSFDPPLVAMGVKPDSGAYAVLMDSGGFALNFLGKGQQGLAFTFFKPAELADGKLSGETYREGANGAALLESALAAAEFSVVEIVEQGDHHTVIGEVVAVHGGTGIEGRPDEAGLHMRDLGKTVFYGG
jgi:flavin reductase (DIM6/NTAB) family NADH-FMN oxidoreductase RutF